MTIGAAPKRSMDDQALQVLNHDTGVLLTGATGLIGGELLRALLANRVRRLMALVRGRPGLDPAVRVANRLRRSGDALPSSVPHLSVIGGDVRQVGLGLTDRDVETVYGETDMIVHCAAETSFIRHADCLRTNTGGMRNLIDFARRCRRNPLIVHVSTAAVSGAVCHGCVHEDESGDPGNNHHNEYTRSKALAEQALRESGLPHLIVRPSIVFSAGLPDSQFARSILWFVPLLNEFEAIPIDPASRLDVVPVGFVVHAIMGLLQAPNRRHHCFHVSSGQDHAITCGRVIQFLNGFYRRTTPLRPMAPSEWSKDCHRRFVRTPQQRRILATLRHYLPFLNMDTAYDNTRLKTELGLRELPIPPLTSYMGELLEAFSYEEALVDSANP